METALPNIVRAGNPSHLDISTGVVLLDETGAVVKSNQTMSRFIERGDGLEIDADNCFLLADEKDKRRRYFDLMVSDSRKDKFASQNTDSDPIKEIHVKHIGNYLIRTFKVVFAHFEYYLLLVVDQCERVRGLCEKIGEHSSLTPAELEVFLQVVRGYNNKSIALNRNVSPQTVKSQIVSIFEKTNTTSRGELAWCVLSQTI